VLRGVADALNRERIRFWLRGGWAVDFHLGYITRVHDDIDAVTWHRHRRRIREVLEATGFEALPSPNPKTQLVLAKDGQEVSFLLVARHGSQVVVPGLERWPFPRGAFGDVVKDLDDLRCRVLPASALLYEKEHHREWSGRSLRPKDVESIRLLYELVRSGREARKVG
jgi:hypothetical protein